LKGICKKREEKFSALGEGEGGSIPGGGKVRRNALFPSPSDSVRAPDLFGRAGFAEEARFSLGF